MKLYDVEGHEHPLLLSEEHAELIGATEHEIETRQPARNASKQSWVDYALGQGGDPLVVESLTRTELVEQYAS